MSAMQIVILLMIAVAGGLVSVTRDPVKQAVGVSFFGMLLAVMFFLYQAPDVALSQIVIGAVALPLMILLAMAKIRRISQQQHDAPESEEQP